MSKSVLIIDTPKTCGDCPLCIYTAEEKKYIGYCNTSNDDYYCKVLERFMEYDEVDGGLDILGKPIDCPLAESEVMNVTEWKLWSEEKPKEETHILVTRDFNNRYHKNRYVEPGVVFNGEFLSDWSEYQIYSDAYSEPIAWMPFPEPYKGE